MSTDKSDKVYHSFKEFYPFYRSQHRNTINQLLHNIGSILVLIVLFYAIFAGETYLFYILPIIGYGFAWVGHFVFEKNKPATFKYPVYSFIGDWVMLYDNICDLFK